MPDSSVSDNNWQRRSGLHEREESIWDLESRKKINVALMISGQPRFALECITTQIGYIGSEVNLYLFIHCWREPESIERSGEEECAAWINANKVRLDSLDEIASRFRVIDYSTTEPPPGDLDSSEGASYRLARMFWGIKEANRLRTSYEEKHGMVFDLAIRARYDVFLVWNSISQLFSSDVSRDTIHYPELIRNEFRPCDWWFYGDGATMNIACNLYDSLKAYLSEGIAESGEELLYEHCSINRIKMTPYKASGYLKRSNGVELESIRRFGKIHARDSILLYIGVKCMDIRVKSLVLASYIVSMGKGWVKGVALLLFK